MDYHERTPEQLHDPHETPAAPEATGSAEHAAEGGPTVYVSVNGVVVVARDRLGPGEGLVDPDDLPSVT